MKTRLSLFLSMHWLKLLLVICLGVLVINLFWGTVYFACGLRTTDVTKNSLLNFCDSFFYASHVFKGIGTNNVYSLTGLSKLVTVIQSVFNVILIAFLSAVISLKFFLNSKE